MTRRPSTCVALKVLSATAACVVCSLLRGFWRAFAPACMVSILSRRRAARVGAKLHGQRPDMDQVLARYGLSRIVAGWLVLVKQQEDVRTFVCLQEQAAEAALPVMLSPPEASWSVRECTA